MHVCIFFLLCSITQNFICEAFCQCNPQFQPTFWHGFQAWDGNSPTHPIPSLPSSIHASFSSFFPVSPSHRDKPDRMIGSRFDSKSPITEQEMIKLGIYLLNSGSGSLRHSRLLLPAILLGRRQAALHSVTDRLVCSLCSALPEAQRSDIPLRPSWETYALLMMKCIVGFPSSYRRGLA
ncbi:hypothetical protein BJX64DRAFT_177801 [Aspergillus heterothallicus]